MSRLLESVNSLRKNDRQWEAFTATGHCVVVAPPGSGKTKLLTTRLAHDLVTKIEPPQGAACITLTNAAADELRRRMESLGVEDRPTLFVGTVHSFMLQKIISRFADVVGRPELRNIRIASKQWSDAALAEVISGLFHGQEIWNVKPTIMRARVRMEDDEQWARYGDRVCEARDRYLAKLRDENLHDFPELVATAVELVEEHRAIRQVLTAEYPRLYVDEYQDLAPGLDRLVQALCFDHVSSAELFAVGDPDQAIFGFTGTRPELLLGLANRSDVHDVWLERNYRCGERIIQLANHVRDGNTPITGDREGGHVSAECCRAGIEQQYSCIADEAIEAHDRGVPFHQIGVLAPLRDQCKRAADVLRDRGVPAFFRDADGTYRLTTVTGFIEGTAAWAMLGRECSDYRLADLLRTWRYVLGHRWTHAHDEALVTFLMSYRNQGERTTVDLIADVLKAGLDQALKRSELADDRNEFARMNKCVADGVLAGISVRELAERARKSGRVEVTTMTSSKGLEFDVVLLAAADEGSMPDWRARSVAERAEDRRKFYVSITRARNELRIFYSGFVVTNRGNKRYDGSSRYLRQVGLVS